MGFTLSRFLTFDKSNDDRGKMAQLMTRKPDKTKLSSTCINLSIMMTGRKGPN